MSKKSAKVAALIESCRGKELDPHYLGYFECFNRGWFYESHDVLEELWLSCRGGPNDAFYKGLIQFAGAFVHLQKHNSRLPRLRPAAGLFKLSRWYLSKYPARHERLDVANVLRLAEEWLERLESANFQTNPLDQHSAPQLHPETVSST